MTDLEFCLTQAQYAFELTTHARARRWVTKLLRRRLGYLCYSPEGIWYTYLTPYGSQWMSTRPRFQLPVVSAKGILLLYGPYLSDVDEAKVHTLIALPKPPLDACGEPWRS